ncbi:MAG: DMT family transporter [Micromonosporaceae bacterium]
MTVVDYVLALGAAVLLGAGFVLQQHVAHEAPKAHFLHLRLLTDLLRKPVWLAGIATMVAGQLTSAWVIGHLELSIAEPLLASNLLFALLLAAPMSGERVCKTEMAGAVILGGGVAALSVTRSAGASAVSFGSFAHWPAAAAIGAVAYGLVHAGRRRPAGQRATLTGLGAGLVFGISDALTRRTVQIVNLHGVTALFTNWPPYCLIATGFVGLWLMQSAFNAGPLHASLPAVTAAEPVAGILLGIVVFGDGILVSPGMLALRAAGMVALVIGVIMVARAPALSGLRKIPAAHRGLTPARDEADAPGGGGILPADPAANGRKDAAGDPNVSGRSSWMRAVRRAAPRWHEGRAAIGKAEEGR